jgi:ribonuclease G
VTKGGKGGKSKGKAGSGKKAAAAKTARSKGMEIMIEELDGSIWVAAVEKGRLEGMEVDPFNEEVRWGSIFWAKVARIDAARDAAFVNLDGENIGILYNADVRVAGKNGAWKKGGDVAIGKVLRPGQMIAVQAKSGYLPKKDERAEEKNPRVSMNIVLSGRYLIHAPMEKENKVSQRIRDKSLRRQLMAMLDNMPDVEGCIPRSAAADTQTDILVREAKILRLTWDQLKSHLKGEDPALIMLGPDAVQRMLSDNAGRQMEHIELTTMEHFQHAEEWCEIFAPDLVTKIVPVELPDQTIELGLFEYRDIIHQIEELFQPYVILKTGATLIIQETAALTAIDVNSGADSRSNLAINLDAAQEIARQLRLRNLGGAIIIDFVRMGKPEYKKLLEALDSFFNENDPCTVQVHGMTNSGFVEVTRQRRTPPLLERFQSTVSQ